MQNKSTSSLRDNSVFNQINQNHSVDNSQFLLRKGTGVDIGDKAEPMTPMQQKENAQR